MSLADFFSSIFDGNDLVVLTMHNQSWDIEFLEIFGEISLGKGLDAFIGILEAGLHTPKPELIQDSLGDLGTFSVGTIERHCKILIELRVIL